MATTTTITRNIIVTTTTAAVTPITALHHLDVVTSFIRPNDAELDTLRALPRVVGASCSP